MKKIIIASILILVCILIVKKKDMTLRQSVLKAVYPLLVAKQKLFPSKTGVLANKEMIKPSLSFHSLKAKTGEGEEILFDKFKGKKILIVNTASDCGYTAQYEELQKLYDEHNKELVILAFPANDFKEQEKGNDQDIEQFCKMNFGVSFPLMQKSIVVKNDQQNEVFEWLTNKTKNGWNDHAPEWNFSKFLVNEQGILTHYFAPAVSPLSKQVKSNL
jgi:glutathione peroxidase